MLKPKFVFAYMKTAHNFAELSYCVRAKVGAVIVKDGRIISEGYNGRPKGEPNICEIEDGSATHPDVRHAEDNSIAKLAKSHDSSVGASLFCTWSPCKQCAIKIVDAEIAEVYYDIRYRDPEGIRYLLDHGVKVYHVRGSEILTHIDENHTEIRRRAVIAV